MNLYKRTTQTYKFETKPLKLLLLSSPQYGANEPGNERTDQKQSRYIRITDIDENGLLGKGLGATADVVESRYILENNDLLIARSGNTVGKSYLHKTNEVDSECFFAGYLLRFKINQNIISPDYLFYFTQLTVYRNWIKAIQRPTGQPNVNAEEYRSLIVPIPPIDVQQQIVEGMAKEYQVKRKKEADAQALLDSIDGYLLAELSITLPPEPDNTIQNRLFRVARRQVSGGRFDPISYSKERVDALDAVNSSKYQLQRLHNIVSFPKIVFSYNPNLLPYLGLENIESNTGFYVETTEKENFGSALYFDECQVLFPKLRPYLNKIYHSISVGICSTEFVILQPKPLINSAFLASFLRSKAVLAQTKHLSSGNTLPRLQTEDTRRLLIPVPPLDLQHQLVETISTIRQQAQTLRAEAQREFAEAKQEIERLILG